MKLESTLFRGKKILLFVLGIELTLFRRLSLRTFLPFSPSVSFLLYQGSSVATENTIQNANLRMRGNCHIACERNLIFTFGFKTYLEETVIRRTLLSKLCVFVVITAE